MNRSRITIATLLICTIQGCATLNKSECREADWRIIGLEDGSSGRPVSFIGRHRKSCAEYGVKPNMAEYQQGHVEGVRTFCTPRKGFELGKGGRGHEDVCPTDLRDAFLAAYEDGREVRVAQQAMLDAQNRVESVNSELLEISGRITALENNLVNGGGSSEDRQSWLQQLKNLQSEQEQKQAELQALVQEASESQGEYRYLDSLFQY